MLRGRKGRFTSAHAIAIAALFFALGGGAYAAATNLAPNSVGTKQLQDGSVTPPKLSKGTIKQLQKIAKRYAPMPVHDAIGPAGPPGPKGEKGDPGPAGPSDVFIGGAAGGTLTGADTVIASITVPPGQYLLQGKTVVTSVEAEKSVAGGCLIGSDAAGSTTWDASEASIPAFPTANATTVISLAGAASFSAEQKVVLSCRSFTGSMSYDDARVWATRVGSLHGLPVPID